MVIDIYGNVGSADVEPDPFD